MKKIKLIEDEMLINLELTTVLSNTDFKICHVSRCWEEAEKYLEDQIDLLIVDLNLKGSKDGIAIASEFNKKRDIPVLFLSGSSLSDFQERIFPFQDKFKYSFLSKPFHESELIQNMEQLTS